MIILVLHCQLKISTLNRKHTNTFTSLDTKSLYTKIPKNEVIKNILQLFTIERIKENL